jgi:hypothetical protein
MIWKNRPVERNFWKRMSNIYEAIIKLDASDRVLGWEVHEQGADPDL